MFPELILPGRWEHYIGVNLVNRRDLKCHLLIRSRFSAHSLDDQSRIRIFQRGVLRRVHQRRHCDFDADVVRSENWCQRPVDGYPYVFVGTRVGKT